jgi:predicted nucleic acid-binding protein
VNEVVVDSSAWIEFFRGRQVPLVETALADGRVLLPPIVVAELVSGATSRADVRQIAELVRALDLIPTPREHWIRVGELRRLLRSRGVVVSTPDAHVAQCALDVNGVLVSFDRCLRRIASHTGLRLEPARA